MCFRNIGLNMADNKKLFPIFVPQGRSKTRYTVGYVDQEGKLAIDPVFKEGTRFREGLASVQVKGGRWGVIDTKGDFVIEPKLSHWCRFQEGLAPLATKIGKYGVIDISGEFVIPPTYSYISSFECELALVRMGEEREARFGFIDRTGAEVIPLSFHRASGFSEGLAAVKVANLWGYIQPSGVFQITPRFDGSGRAKRWPDTRAGKFVDGVAPVWAGQDYHRFIDTTGAFAFEGGFDDANSFSEGLAVIQRGDCYGYIDMKGQMAIECNFTLARDFSEGLAKVEVEESRYGRSLTTGFIDRAGRMAIKPQFYSADSFYDGLSLVSTEESLGYINRSGEYVWRGPFVDYGLVI